MTNLNTIEVQFISPTNFRGARVKMKSPRFNSSVTINYDCSMSNIYDMAQKWLESKGFVCEFMSEGRNCYMIHSSTFVDIKKV